MTPPKEPSIEEKCLEREKALNEEPHIRKCPEVESARYVLLEAAAEIRRLRAKERE